MRTSIRSLCGLQGWLLAAPALALGPDDIVRAAAGTRHAAATRPASALAGESDVFDLHAAGREREALLALSKLATRGGPELAAAEREARRRLGTPLPQVLAQWRLDDALARARRGPFRLRGVTRYEAYALGTLLVQHERRWLDTVHAGRTLEALTRTPLAYDRLHEGAQTMVAQARLVAAMMSQRLRFDPVLDHEAPQREMLAAQRDRLMRFTTQVSAMPGFTSLPPSSLFAAAPTPASTQPALPRRAGSLFDDD